MSASRRQFLMMAAAMGVPVAWADRRGQSSRLRLRETRDLYPEGVASGDPDAHSVLLWTRRSFAKSSQASLQVLVAEDDSFTRVVARTRTQVSAAADWTCRVWVGNLEPSAVYWYRFVGDDGNASRVGRTITAPLESDSRPRRFAFVSCQNLNHGAQHAYRRMIFEDERAADGEKLGFVLHLGDFYYQGVIYPEDQPKGFYGRPLREVLRYRHGEKVGDYHFPTTLEDYRAVHRAYLHDPDLQDARARWPFVCIWDNGEFSWEGWQSLQVLDAQGSPRPAQTRKVMANQAWFEFQPARIRQSGKTGLSRFDTPHVVDAPIPTFDRHGLGQEPNNLAALGSLTGYRSLRWGANIELIVTDQRSYRSEAPLGRTEAKSLRSEAFPEMVPEEALEILDAGHAYANGAPPSTIRIGNRDVANFRAKNPPQTMLGAAQKQWFLERLKNSKATWKIWGNTLGTLDGRADPNNLPAGLTSAWPGSGYAVCQLDDFATAYRERAEIYDAVRKAQITGFVTVSGNSHSFWAGLAAPSLPPKPFEPVGVAFITGAISSVGLAEYMESTLPQDHPLRALYVPAFNLLVRHGVRACLEYQRSGDLERARRLSNPELSPHLSFLDLGGHGYSTVRASSDVLECEFVCIPRPIERIDSPEGGPLRYRVVHRVPLWRDGERPRLEQRIVEGDPGLSL